MASEITSIWLVIYKFLSCSSQSQVTWITKAFKVMENTFNGLRILSVTSLSHWGRCNYSSTELVNSFWMCKRNLRRFIFLSNDFKLIQFSMRRSGTKERCRVSCLLGTHVISQTLYNKVLFCSAFLLSRDANHGP